MSSLFLMANGALNILLVPYAVDRLHLESDGVGLLLAALGAGTWSARTRDA
ncbi:hypothetical protein NKH77_44495 [Streptomyces sp. M19]